MPLIVFNVRTIGENEKSSLELDYETGRRPTCFVIDSWSLGLIPTTTRKHDINTCIGYCYEGKYEDCE